MGLHKKILNFILMLAQPFAKSKPYRTFLVAISSQRIQNLWTGEGKGWGDLIIISTDGPGALKFLN
jgi:hypothetical protein